DELLRLGPRVPEYQALDGAIALDLGEALRFVPAGLAEGERKLRLQEAEAMLVATLAGLGEREAGEPVDPRVLLLEVDLRRVLTRTYLLLGRRDDALAQVQGIFDSIE